MASERWIANGVPRRVYLDHAATSWPKPHAVLEAMKGYLSDIGASAGRGAYQSARQANQIVDTLRHQLAQRINANTERGHDASISLHSGCTLAIHTLIESLQIDGPFDVLVSAADHNAVLRGWHHRCQRDGGQFIVVPTDAAGRIDVDALNNAITAKTRVIAVTHASNVTGFVQPIDLIGKHIKAVNEGRDPDQQIFFFSDAAQTFGYLPVNVSEFGVHGLVAPAHKGSKGPPGIAMLYIDPAWHHRVHPVVHGGTGHDGASMTMPKGLPGKLEAGTMNLPAVAGWLAAIELENDDSGGDDTELASLSAHLHAGLASIDSVRVIGQPGPLPIASIEFESELSPQEAAAILDSEFGIEVRAGHHCAARIHNCLMTERLGTLRFSGGHTTTMNEIDYAVDAVMQIAESVQALSSVSSSQSPIPTQRRR
ncbi:MAG: aminotransferase class V-fold PLP-dependent enzyme [Planctomycetota bacterium]